MTTCAECASEYARSYRASWVGYLDSQHAAQVGSKASIPLQRFYPSRGQLKYVKSPIAHQAIVGTCSYCYSIVEEGRILDCIALKGFGIKDQHRDQLQ